MVTYKAIPKLNCHISFLIVFLLGLKDLNIQAIAVEFCFWMTLGSSSRIYTKYKHYIFLSDIVMHRLFWVTLWSHSLKSDMSILTKYIYLRSRITVFYWKENSKRCNCKFLYLLFVHQAEPSICSRKKNPEFVWDVRIGRKATGQTGIRGTSLCARACSQSNRNMENKTAMEIIDNECNLDCQQKSYLVSMFEV